MDKIEKIRQKIKELRELLEDHNYYLDNSEQALGYSAALDDIEEFLDTLSEEPDKGLEEAAKEYAEGPECTWVGTTALEEAFKAGAKWQAEKCDEETSKLLYAERQTAYINGWDDYKEQMLKDAVEGYVNYYEDGGGILMAEAQVGCPYHVGDKVRLVVLKAEEE